MHQPEPADIWETIEYSPLAVAVAQSTWLFPTIESLHVIALVTMVGTIAILDLRLIGLASRAHHVSLLARDVLPLTWGGFLLAAITGGLLFASRATSYVANPFFLWKMALLVLAGLNMGVFHLTAWRQVERWETGGPIPLGARLAGGLSLVFWVMVVFLGRAIGFTEDYYS